MKKAPTRRKTCKEIGEEARLRCKNRRSLKQEIVDTPEIRAKPLPVKKKISVHTKPLPVQIKESQLSSINIENLPNETIFAILLQAPVEDILNVCKTSKRFKDMCRDNLLWFYIYQRDVSRIDILGRAYNPENDYKDSVKNRPRLGMIDIKSKNYIYISRDGSVRVRLMIRSEATDTFRRADYSIYPPPGKKFIGVAASIFKFFVILVDDGSIIQVSPDQLFENLEQSSIKPPQGKRFVQVSGGAHFFGLLDSGDILIWDPITPRHHFKKPPKGRKFIQISNRPYHSLGLLDSGTVLQWDDDFSNRAPSINKKPPGGKQFVQISAGYKFSLGLLNDGSIVGWGRNDHGQALSLKKPPNGKKFVQISAGGAYSLGLLNDGTMIGWGYNKDGQAPRITKPPVGKKFVQVGASQYNSVVLLSDGTVMELGKW